MSGFRDNPTRDAILARVSDGKASGIDRPAEVPLDWDDIGLLCQGLVFGSRPLLAATRSVTEKYSLGPRGAWMLNLIEGGVAYPNELSEVFQIGRSLVSAELARLTEAGLVTSTPGATDKRRTELALTDAGKQATIKIRGELNFRLTTALDGYSPAEVRLFSRMLQDLRLSVTPSASE